MSQIYKVNPKKVIVAEDRHRKHFDAGASVKMMASLRKFGQLQPGICTKIGEDLHLLAGERRLRGCVDAEIEFSYLLKEEIDDPLFLEEIELEENIQRENLTYQEEVLAKERLHSIKQQRKPGHTMEDTAAQLGETKGLISQDIELAYFIKFSPEVSKARNKTEAKKIVKRIKDTAARAKLLEESLAKETAKESIGENKATLVDTLGARIKKLSQRVLHGLFEERIKEVDDNSVDVVIFDPPWGVDYDTVSLDDGSKQMFEDKKDVILEQLPQWLEVLYAKLRNDSHIYLFFGIINYEFIYRSLEAAGFRTNGMPLFWHKQGSHRTRNPEVWPGRCYEAIAYARKGNKALTRQGAPDVISTPPPTGKMKASHPSAKHPAIYLDLLTRSCLPGDMVLDPMCGSGMFGVACEQLALTHNLNWWMIEKEKNFVELSIFNMVEGYGKITSEAATPVEVAPHEKYNKWADDLASAKEEKTKGGFASLEPGTAEWKTWWKEHPGDQDAMLAFAKERKEGR